jgi:hypothetical protein
MDKEKVFLPIVNVSKAPKNRQKYYRFSFKINYTFPENLFIGVIEFSDMIMGKHIVSTFGDFRKAKLCLGAVADVQTWERIKLFKQNGRQTARHHTVEQNLVLLTLLLSSNSHITMHIQLKITG